MSDEKQKPSEQEVEQVRSRTQEIANRAKNDQAFREKLNSDPVATLKAEGLPENAVNELMHATGKQDVVGHYWYYECWYYTTWWEEIWVY